MERYDELSAELKEMLTVAEEQLDWSYTVRIEPSQNNRTYAEMRKYSPAGEDFNMVIDFDKDNQAETFLADLRDYAENFDIDEHVEMWLPSRGKGGCPSSLKELLEDARDIKAMIEELLDKLENMGEQELELSDEQIARNDEIYNAVYDMCKVIAGNEDLEWDMHYIGEIAELAANLLITRGEKVRFPAVVTGPDGKQHIEEYYEPEGEA